MRCARVCLQCLLTLEADAMRAERRHRGILSSVSSGVENSARVVVGVAEQTG